MNLAIVVGAFPVLSQSFIVRMIESLYDFDIRLTVYAIEGFDRNALQKLAPRLFDLIDSGQIIIRCPSTKYHNTPSRLHKLVSSIGDVLQNPIFVFRLSMLGLSTRATRHALSFRKLAFGHQHDLVHTQFLTLAVSVVGVNMIDQRFDTIVSYARGFDISRRGEISSREFSLFSRVGGLAQIICVSKSLAQLVIDRGYPAAKVGVVHSGIPIEGLNFVRPSHRQHSVFRFVQVGRLIDKKGYQLTLEMLARLKFTNYKLHIVGEGELVGKLHQLCQKLDLKDRVVFHGALTHAETIREISLSDFMLIPSLTGRNGDAEGIPNVAKEAMALGVICIASDHSGIPELISHGDSGFLFPEGDLDQYVDVVVRAINLKSEWDRIAIKAREFVEQNFDTHNVARKLLDFYSLAASSSTVRHDRIKSHEQ